MRTLLERIGVSSKQPEERLYSVEGDIVFEFTPAPGHKCSAERIDFLQHVIRFVDAQFPWVDRTDYSGEKVPSIGHIGEPVYQYHNLSTPELHVWFRVVPFINCVRKGQIHAYERYLQKLAEEAWKQNFGTKSVRSVFPHR
ncbi:MAG: hypothetical protein Q7R67_01435 [bacterium]|nr:hypothetical protein [bacterium]